MDEAGLRERNAPQRTPTAEKAMQGLNAEEYYLQKDMKDKRTFGRTPDGIGRYLTINVCCPYTPEERTSTVPQLTGLMPDNLLT